MCSAASEARRGRSAPTTCGGDKGEREGGFGGTEDEDERKGVLDRHLEEHRDFEGKGHLTYTVHGTAGDSGKQVNERLGQESGFYGRAGGSYDLLGNREGGFSGGDNLASKAGDQEGFEVSRDLFLRARPVRQEQLQGADSDSDPCELQALTEWEVALRALACWHRQPEGQRRQAFDRAVNALAAAHEDPEACAGQLEALLADRELLCEGLVQVGVRRELAEDAVEEVLGFVISDLLGLESDDSGSGGSLGGGLSEDFEEEEEEEDEGEHDEEPEEPEGDAEDDPNGR
jgi:hypothetical protein